jgi:hypothetical protein
MSRSKVSEEQQRELDITEHEDDIYYSPRYQDDIHEFRHVVLPKQIAKWVPSAFYFNVLNIWKSSHSNGGEQTDSWTTKNGATSV